MGKMGLRPDDFWGMSWREFALALEGFSEFHGGGSNSGRISKEEADDLIRRADEFQARRREKAEADGAIE